MSLLQKLGLTISAITMISMSGCKKKEQSIEASKNSASNYTSCRFPTHGLDNVPSLIAADFDGDGDMDLVLAVQSPNSSYSNGYFIDTHLCINDGKGNFSPYIPPVVPQQSPNVPAEKNEYQK